VSSPVIGLWSPKGGVGKTTLAASLATHLTARSDRVMLIDLDAGKADIAPLLQTPLKPSILDNPSAEQVFMHPLGFRVLPGAARLVDEGLVTGDAALGIINRARDDGYTVILDLDADLRDSTLLAMEQADAVLLLTTPDLLSVYPVRRFRQEAELIRIGLDHFHLVVNHSGPNQAISDREILELVQVPLAGRVPYLPELPTVVSSGRLPEYVRNSPVMTAAMEVLTRCFVNKGLLSETPVAATSRTAPHFVKRWWSLR
jgi:pilus assembly protein CpaE